VAKVDQTIKELDTYKLECEEAQSKVGQMEVIKKKMDGQLEANERDVKVYVKKSEELEATQETENHSVKEGISVSCVAYNLSNGRAKTETYEAMKQQLKECKEKLKLEETKTNSEVTEKIKISTERDELQHQYNRLNAIVVEQDDEIKLRTQNVKQMRKEVLRPQFDFIVLFYDDGVQPVVLVLQLISFCGDLDFLGDLTVSLGFFEFELLLALFELLLHGLVCLGLRPAVR
jgi:hypothetical protein